MADVMSVADLNAWREEGRDHVLVDVREEWEREICSVSGALGIPMGTIPDRLADLPKTKPLVVMCHHGGRSMQVVRWLQANGYANAINLTGGIHAWSMQIDPEVPTY